MISAARSWRARFVAIVDATSRAAGVFATLLLAGAVLIVCQMIFVRYVLNGSTFWQTEFVIYSIVAATFIGSPYVLLHRGHVRVDLLPDALTGRARIALELLAGLLSIAFCGLLAWSGWHYFYEAAAGGWKTETRIYALWIPVLPLPLGMALLCLQYVAELLKLTGEPR